MREPPSLALAQMPSDSAETHPFPSKGILTPVYLSRAQPRGFVKELLKLPHPGGPLGHSSPQCLLKAPPDVTSSYKAATTPALGLQSEAPPHSPAMGCAPICVLVGLDSSRGQELVCCLLPKCPIPGRAHKGGQLVQMTGHAGGKLSPPLSQSVLLGQHPTISEGFLSPLLL